MWSGDTAGYKTRRRLNSVGFPVLVAPHPLRRALTPSRHEERLCRRIHRRCLRWKRLGPGHPDQHPVRCHISFRPLFS